MKKSMHVFHTAGVPPSNGVLSLPMSGCTDIKSEALVKSVKAKTASIVLG